ncbi:MAG: 5-bromo-4-chloroindolyl phosphate hydrolysis family protein [Deltaproteobacteria bacterium]|jgi:hypothetical protein|nr:5-bromo-4-chloroindolyl phosphate hydrolysis family protein [Deltaproteobacteria bacterium]
MPDAHTPQTKAQTLFSRLASRLGFHAAALLAALLLGQGEIPDCFRAYIGLLCLFPSNLARREPSALFPSAIGLGQLAVLLFQGGFTPGQALFVAGVQSWLLGAIIRRFRLGMNWLVFPLLLLGAVGEMSNIFPFFSFALAVIGGAGAYACGAWFVRWKERTAAVVAAPEPAPETQGEFDEFWASLALLREKNTLLSPALREHTEALARAAGDILACMRDDVNIRPAGARFLTRYLPAAHVILDEHLRLSASVEHAHVQESLESGANMLKRLAVAFREEHGHLLRDDIMRFNAEMTILDKLLKIDGR